MLELYKKEIFSIKEGVYYGIDLGTTYTVITQVDVIDIKPGDGYIPVKIITIPQHSPFEYDGSDQSEMIASILGVDKKGKMYVGNKLYLLKGHPDFIKDENLFYHWKLDLGLSLKPLYRNAAREDIDDASKVAGKLLNYCRLNHFQKDRIWENVVITVPASFQANQRQDVLQAVEYARIKRDEQMLIDEPNAAFLGYLNDASDKEKKKIFTKISTHILVVDFGGGTCDLSVLKIEKPEKIQLKISNLAISRYNDLGGQDIDSLIAELYLLPYFLKKYKEVDFSSKDIEEIIMPQLSVIAEKLKIDLARTVATRYIWYNDIPEESEIISKLENHSIVHAGAEYKVEEFSLSFNEFRKINKHIFTSNEYQLQVVDKVIQSVPSVVKDILKKANLRFTDIHNVLFVGGSVQNMMFVQETMYLFSDAQALIPGRSDLLIAKGAAIYSFYKNALGIELLQPISSDTIGVILHNTPFYPIIEAGKPLPISVLLPDFTTQSVFQSMVNIPFCVNNEENIVGELDFTLPRIMTKEDVISIKANLSIDKVFTVEIYAEDELLSKKQLNNPYILANASKQERKLQEMLIALDNAKLHNNTSQEKTLLENLIFEYYDLGNYTRAGTLGEEWLKKFDKTSIQVNNLLFCAYNNLGNRRKARFHLEQGLKYSPSNSTLNYNMGIQIEEEEGSKAALDYLTSLPEELQEVVSIKFRIALISYSLNNPKLAYIIRQEYKEGKYRNVSLFIYNLLKKILNLLHIDIHAKPSYQEENISINKENLLNVNASGITRSNQ